MSKLSEGAAKPVGRHAIVYGGSMVGLVTAGMLSRHFERVTLVERDRFEPGPHPRKGVPQAVHIHGLLSRGMDIFCDVFPGLPGRLEAAGGRLFDMTEPHAWFAEGAWRPQAPCGLRAYGMSRLLLEWVVRERLQQLANVHILDGREVSGLKVSADKRRITGVHVQAPGGAHAEALEGELVADCTGRGSRTPQWLEGLGLPRVEETHIHVNVVYASRLYRRPPGFAPGWENMSISPRLPQERKMGIVQAIEDDRWLALVGGWLGEGPSATDEAFLAFTRTLAQPHMYEALRNAEPLGPVHVYRFSHNQRRHYERMVSFPEGLAVVGDAFCSFNPIYGQGMTTGALQAETLGECLQQGLEGVSQRYRQRVGRLLDGPWGMATSGDLRIPEVQGTRSPLAGLLNWYGDRLQRLTFHDREALVTFLRVVHMLDTPAALFSPRLALKVLTQGGRLRGHTPGPAPLSASRVA